MSDHKNKVSMVESERPLECAMCPTVLTVMSATTQHPEAPEMLYLPPRAWFGYVAGDAAPEVVVVCSRACLEKLLSH